MPIIFKHNCPSFHSILSFIYSRTPSRKSLGRWGFTNNEMEFLSPLFLQPRWVSANVPGSRSRQRMYHTQTTEGTEIVQRHTFSELRTGEFQMFLLMSPAYCITYWIGVILSTCSFVYNNRFLTSKLSSSTETWCETQGRHNTCI
jgi:hypothetical protein